MNGVLFVGGFVMVLFVFYLWLGFNKRRVGLDGLDWDDGSDAWMFVMVDVSENVMVIE